MLSGQIYSAVDPELVKELNAVKEMIRDYDDLRPSDKQAQRMLLKGLLGNIADDELLIIQYY